MLSDMDEPGPRSGKLTVLLVEDEPAVRRMQTVSLQEAGPFHVLNAAEGQEALDLLRNTAVDAVVTDLQMPGMNGFQLVAELSTRYPALPVIVLTGSIGSAHLDPGVMSGSLHIHLKPPDYPTLSRQIHAFKSRPMGSTRGVGIPSLLQLLQWEGKSATVTVRASGHIGHLYLMDGQLIHAECGELQDQEAALAICTWDCPSVEFVDTCRVAPTFSLWAEELQMALALRRDEGQS